MSKLHIKASVEHINGKMLAIASEEIEDRDGEVLSIDGWDLKNFKKNPRLLWYHNMGERTLPIGKAENIRFQTVDGRRKLVFEPVFEEITEFGRTVKRFFQEDWLNSFSVGFVPMERDGNKYTKQELLEISAVPVPALPSAQIISRAEEEGFNKMCVKALLGDKKAVDELLADGKKDMGDTELKGEAKGEEKAEEAPEKKAEEVKTEEASKTVVPFKSFEKSEDSRDWDARSAVSRIKKWASGDSEQADMAKVKQAFTWYDDAAPDDIASYKLPHHDVQGNDLITVWRGVAASMAMLLGAQGGSDIPEADRKGVYEHLKKHYEEFGKEVPEYRFVELQVLKGLDEEIGAVYEDYTTQKLMKTLYKIRDEIKETRQEVKKNEKKELTGKEKQLALLRALDRKLSKKE